MQELRERLVLQGHLEVLVLPEHQVLLELPVPQDREVILDLLEMLAEQGQVDSLDRLEHRVQEGTAVLLVLRDLQDLEVMLEQLERQVTKLCFYVKLANFSSSYLSTVDISYSMENT